MSIAINIRALREKFGLTQQQLGEIAGVSDKAVSTWEKGMAVPRMGAIQKIADHFQLSKSQIIEDDVLYSLPPPSALRIPVLGFIPAGIPIEAIEDVLDWEEVPADWGRGGQEYFALRIKGASMEPVYLDGDVLIFRQQDTCDSGQDCAVMVNGNDATFKRVHRQPNGITIQPLNPAYSPMFYSQKEIEELPVLILGVVFEIRRKVR